MRKRLDELESPNGSKNVYGFRLPYLVGDVELTSSLEGDETGKSATYVGEDVGS